MTGFEMVEALQSKHIAIVVDGDNLRVNAPVGVLTADLLLDLAERKSEILTAIRAMCDLRALKEQRAALGERVAKGCDYLAALAMRVGPDSPEYDRYFAEWEELNEEYKYFDDLYCRRLEESQTGGKRA